MKHRVYATWCTFTKEIKNCLFLYCCNRCVDVLMVAVQQNRIHKIFISSWTTQECTILHENCADFFAGHCNDLVQPSYGAAYESSCINIGQQNC